MSVGNQQILLRTSINNNKRAKEKMRKKGREKGSARKHCTYTFVKSKTPHILVHVSNQHIGRHFSLTKNNFKKCYQF